MTDIDALLLRVRQQIESPAWRNHPVPGALGAVLDLHCPHRIYDDCGHQPHDYAPDGSVPAGMVEIEGVGLVCEQGYQYSICRHCCADVVDDRAYQSEECAIRHSHGAESPCSPCATVRVIAEALGVQRKSGLWDVDLPGVPDGGVSRG